jgi:Major Facilitator Superfamily
LDFQTEFSGAAPQLRQRRAAKPGDLLPWSGAGRMRTIPGAAHRMTKNTGLVLAACCLAMLSVGDNSTAVMAALPAMSGDLHLDSAAVEWVVNAYLLAAAAFILLGGEAADRFGARRSSINSLPAAGDDCTGGLGDRRFRRIDLGGATASATAARLQAGCRGQPDRRL